MAFVAATLYSLAGFFYHPRPVTRTTDDQVNLKVISPNKVDPIDFS